jgi:phosphopantothenoylcysteine decarboxylase/phosphopantothenate--cysteine ligase
MGHIELSRAADLVVVAPATADLMAKMAGGHADDLVSTLLMATDKRVLIAPAMNVRMWEHPATQRNLATLRADGVAVVGPDEGAMACGEFGPGAWPNRRRSSPRSAEMRRARRPAQGPASARSSPAGPTHEPIDPVRYIANRSSGAQGIADRRGAGRARRGVTLVTGPTTRRRPRA